MDTDELMMEYWKKQLDKRSVIDNHASQPGGPWQAGAGEFPGTQVPHVDRFPQFFMSMSLLTHPYQCNMKSHSLLFALCRSIVLVT